MDDLENARSPVELCHETYDLIAGIRAAAADCSATLQTVSQRGYNSQRMSKADTGYLIIAQGGDGYAEGAAMAVRQDTPFVMINPPSARTPCVRVDMRVGPYEAVSHLSQSGHRRIAYVGSAAGDWFAPRFAGYRRALMENDLPFDPALVIETDGVEAQQDERALDRLLTLSSPPTAIFACFGLSRPASSESLSPPGNRSSRRFVVVRLRRYRRNRRGGTRFDQRPSSPV